MNKIKIMMLLLNLDNLNIMIFNPGYGNIDEGDEKQQLNNSNKG